MRPFEPEEGQHPWLEWIKQVHAISHWGLTYSQDPFDLERYEVLKSLSVQMMADFAVMDKSRIETLFANEEGYITPKVDVRGVVFQHGSQGDKVLLVQEKRDQRWTIPGGWADVGLSPGEVAAKEVLEEAGLEVRPVKMLAMLDRKFYRQPASAFHIYKVFIQCEVVGGQPQAGLETMDARFFAKEELPELSPYKVTPEQMDLIFQHGQAPNRPTDFN